MVSAVYPHAILPESTESKIFTLDSVDSGWIFAPGFPANLSSAHTRYVAESTKLRYISKRHTKRLFHQILACQNPASQTPHNRPCSPRQNLNPKYLIARNKARHPAHLPHIITLGIGGNMGSERQILARFSHLLRSLLRTKSCQLIYASPIYRNPPFGYLDQPHFYNATLTLRSSLSITQLFARVFYLERRFGRGRKRAFKNAPRTLDIDIIFYDKVIIKRAYLTIPHGEFHKRESILLPLSFETMYLRSGSCKPLLTAVRPQPRH